MWEADIEIKYFYFPAIHLRVKPLDLLYRRPLYTLVYRIGKTQVYSEFAICRGCFVTQPRPSPLDSRNDKKRL